MLRVNITSDLARLKMSDLQEESLIYRVKIDLCAERLIYREKECLYTEHNGHFPYWNNLKKTVSRTSICIFLLFVDDSLIKMRK